MDRKKKTRKWKVVAAAAALVIVAAMVIPQLMKLPEVETASVARTDVVRLIKETGTVEAAQTIVITAKSAMEVEKFDFSEGDTVKAGDVILQTDTTAAQLTIRSMEYEAAALRVQYQQAKTTADQDKTLYDQGVISKDAYNQSAAVAKQLASQLTALQYSIESMRESVDDGGITSPIDGTVTEIFIDAGELVQPGSAIMEISDLSNRYVKVNLISDDADLVKTGGKATVYNEDAGYRNEAALVRKIYLKAFEQVSDPGIAQKRVTVEIDLADGKDVRLGSDVDVEIVVDSRENVLSVPEKATFETSRGIYQVYVVENGTIAMRDIEIGLKGEDDWEVLSGLDEGDVVVLSPDNDIEAGMKVKIKQIVEGEQ